MDELKLGMIGLDTSHVSKFTKMLNDHDHTHHVPGGKVVIAYPGGSPDFEKSASRVEGFTKELSEDYGVQIVGSPEEVAENVDAILLTSVDGRLHLEQFRAIASYGKPVFIDKPLAVSSQDAREIARIAQQHGVVWMSSSSRRFSAGLSTALRNDQKGGIVGADCYGPLKFQPTQTGLYWYGIHTAETLFAILGRGCVAVQALRSKGHDVVSGVWEDGRIGTLRGDHGSNLESGALIHREKGTDFASMANVPAPHYHFLLKSVITMFQGGTPQVDERETLEIIRFAEAANESRETGKPVDL